jgi:hypothetical protein
VAGLFSIVWMALGRSADFTEIGACFFLTVTSSWLVLGAAKLWPIRNDDSWTRRTCMMVLGLFVGILALWLDGRQWSTLIARNNPGELQADDEAVADRAGGPSKSSKHPVFRSVLPFRQSIPAAAGYLSYFGLAFFALRWWRMADPKRPQRFSLFPVLAAGFWAYVLLFLLWPWPQAPSGVIALVMTSAIVQIVSPWEEPPPPRAKRLRLNYA